MGEGKGHSDRGIRTEDSGADETAPQTDSQFGDEGIDDSAAGDRGPGAAQQKEERRREEKGNRGPDENPGFGQGA